MGEFDQGLIDDLIMALTNRNRELASAVKAITKCVTALAVEGVDADRKHEAIVSGRKWIARYKERVPTTAEDEEGV
jgi:hypothetical protein